MSCVLVQNVLKPDPFSFYIDDLVDCVEMGVEYTIIGVPCHQRREANGHVTVSTVLEVSEAMTLIIGKHTHSLSLYLSRSFSFSVSLSVSFSTLSFYSLPGQ